MVSGAGAAAAIEERPPTRIAGRQTRVANATVANRTDPMIPPLLQIGWEIIAPLRCRRAVTLLSDGDRSNPGILRCRAN